MSPLQPLHIELQTLESSLFSFYIFLDFCHISCHSRDVISKKWG